MKKLIASFVLFALVAVSASAAVSVTLQSATGITNIVSIDSTGTNIVTNTVVSASTQAVSVNLSNVASMRLLGTGARTGTFVLVSPATTFFFGTVTTTTGAWGIRTVVTDSYSVVNQTYATTSVQVLIPSGTNTYTNTMVFVDGRLVVAPY